MINIEDILEDKICKICSKSYRAPSFCYCNKCLKNNKTQVKVEAEGRFANFVKWRTRKKISYGVLIYIILVAIVYFNLGIWSELVCVLGFSLGLMFDSLCEYLSDKF